MIVSPTTSGLLLDLGAALPTDKADASSQELRLESFGTSASQEAYKAALCATKIGWSFEKAKAAFSITADDGDMSQLQQSAKKFLAVYSDEYRLSHVRAASHAVGAGWSVERAKGEFFINDEDTEAIRYLQLVQKWVEADRPPRMSRDRMEDYKKMLKGDPRLLHKGEGRVRIGAIFLMDPGIVHHDDIVELKEYACKCKASRHRWTGSNIYAAVAEMTGGKLRPVGPRWFDSRRV